MTITLSPTRKRLLYKLSIISAIFIIPLLLAWYLVHHKGLLSETTNYGYLISPPFPVSSLKMYNGKGQMLNNWVFARRAPSSVDQRLIGSWVLLVINPTQCEQACKTMLYNVRQIHTATGKDQDRVRTALLSFPGQQTPKMVAQMLDPDYKDTLSLWMQATDFNTVVNQYVKLPYAAQEGALYMIDPLGNVMMVYKPDADPSSILDDLQHVLQVSQIG